MISSLSAACQPVSGGLDHLKVLKDAGLVIDRRAGSRRMYQVDPDGIGALRAYLDRFWNRALVAFKAAVEEADIEHGVEEAS